MMMLKEKTNAEEMAQIIDEKKEDAEKLLDALTSIGLTEKFVKNGKVEYSLKREIAENKLLRARVGSRILSSLEG
jgi:predicted transcriptional regulator